MSAAAFAGPAAGPDTPVDAGAARPHPLLGANVSTLRGYRFRTHFTGAEFVLADHVVAGRPTLPGVAQLELARAAGELVAEEPIGRLHGVVWFRPLVVTGGGLTVDVGLRSEGVALAFEVTSLDGTVLHARGRLTPTGAARLAQPAPVDLVALRNRASEPLAGTACYRIFDDSGLHYGPSFRGIEALYRTPDAVLARVVLPAGTPSTGFVLHPSVLDAALQSAIGFRDDLTDPGTDQPYVPFDLGGVEILGPVPAAGWAYARPAAGVAGSGGRRLDVDLLDDTGLPRVRLRNLTLRAMPGDGATGPVAAVPPTDDVNGTGPLDELERMLSRLASGHIDISDAKNQLEEMQ
ncbi:conserved hypothetical protein [Micromonospora sp. ATCC 39149]|uniref:polyketide synthase dehydratase domain-containing protein n=1 Tax=Micromonospora sp. (strain ATCC 39149 / NRRL 15099 / SCC 1413) TaxID=219305 RepID=UPI0001A50A99|nr:polyketide synthase dehydratase domain-containing protein [Micromonospora sp. ATCC 39149]EEP74863.1 conserved hypothetical protein [Micromonospora sp. ATCC 39149]